MGKMRTNRVKTTTRVFLNYEDDTDKFEMEKFEDGDITITSTDYDDREVTVVIDAKDVKGVAEWMLKGFNDE